MLEPSAGTGLLTIHAELAGARLALNEIAGTRADLLARLFPDTGVTRHDAAHIHDHLDPVIRPSVVLMNPPFSVAAHVDGRVYARHGTAVETRLPVIDRIPAADPATFPTSLGMASDTATLLDWVARHVPPRPVATARSVIAPTAPPAARKTPPARALPRTRSQRSIVTNIVAPASAELAYKMIDWKPAQNGHITDALYEGYTLQSIRVPGSQPHPIRLVQSAAMASVAPPKPCYRPHLPPDLVSNGVLSDAQLESIIFAGEAHSGYLAGAWTVDETFDVVFAASDKAENAVRFRRGLGDGKGRQVAGIILDNWLKGRRRAL
jgi:P-loop containing NTP hydrolase pore-1